MRRMMMMMKFPEKSRNSRIPSMEIIVNLQLLCINTLPNLNNRICICRRAVVQIRYKWLLVATTNLYTDTCGQTITPICSTWTSSRNRNPKTTPAFLRFPGASPPHFPVPLLPNGKALCARVDDAKKCTILLFAAQAASPWARTRGMFFAEGASFLFICLVSYILLLTFSHAILEHAGEKPSWSHCSVMYQYTLSRLQTCTVTPE